MSWPQWQGQQQPAIPALINPAAAAPVGIPYSPEQWQQMQQQNWQQWAQWQQQYQQWHQQYGAEYQKSLNAIAGTLMTPQVPQVPTMQVAPPPLPQEKPPLPPEEPPVFNMSTFNSIQPSVSTANTLIMNPKVVAGRPMDINQKRPANSQMPSSDPKKNKLDAVWRKPDVQNQQQKPSNNSEEDMPEAEKKFVKQFAEWEAQFKKWKEQNQNHPDKAQYREYEKKWEAWRNQLLERRDLMRRKRLGLMGNKPANFSENKDLAKSVIPSAAPSGSGPSLEKQEDASSLFFRPNSSAGIPGLDLVDASKAETEPIDGQNEEKGNLQLGPNLEELSKNINSILGDQKLLSMLSLVASQNPQLIGKTNEAANTDVQNIQNHNNWACDESSNFEPSKSKPSETCSNNYNGNPDQGLQNNVFTSATRGNMNGNNFESEQPILEMASNDPMDDNHWQAEPEGQNSLNMAGEDEEQEAPAAPLIQGEDFDDLLCIENVTDYEHKSKKTDSFEVAVIPPRLFDYRHKLVNRIPIPERPKWLIESFRQIPEFEPPIQRIQQPYQRYYENTPYNRRPAPNFNNPVAPTFNPPVNPNFNRPVERLNRYPNEFTPKSRPDYNNRQAAGGNFDRRKLSSEPVKVVRSAVNTNSYSPPTVLLDDLLNAPGRHKRPEHIVIILRGPPGSGKTFLAKLIKDKETENGGSAPRILSLDDYFMVEQEKQTEEDGKTVVVKEMVYEFEESMEATYIQSLLKAFRKTITDGYFNFVIVDNVNDKIKNFKEMWSFAKQSGFQVYICQLELDVQVCSKRNTHGRSETEIRNIVNGWEALPPYFTKLDPTNLIQSAAIPEVEMEEINSPNDDFGDDDFNEEEDDEDRTGINSSKWDNFECSNDNLAKLDGIGKLIKSSQTIKDYLQLDDEWTPKANTKPGQKRVRWADLEERKQQEKLRAIGFVVGQTDWNRMMDPTNGGAALTQVKFIERVGTRKLS